MTNTSRKPLPTVLAMSPATLSGNSDSQSNQPKPEVEATQSSSTDSNVRPHPTPELPTPKLRVKCNDLQHQGSDLFFETNNAARCMSEAVRLVLSILYHPASSPKNIPSTRSVTLILRAFGGVAYTTGIELDDDHKEIHFSLNHITNVNSQSAQRTGKEIRGVLVHEMVHAWQWNGEGTAPGGLIEGIADFVRLRAGLGPPHWKKEIPDSWDAGYQHTAYFLDWLEETNGSGTVQKINLALKGQKYDENKFWNHLFGKDVDQLFEEYKTHLKPRESQTGAEARSMEDDAFWNMIKESKGDEMAIVLKARWRVQKHGIREGSKDFENLDQQLNDLWHQYNGHDDVNNIATKAQNRESKGNDDDDDAVLVAKDDGI